MGCRWRGRATGGILTMVPGLEARDRDGQKPASKRVLGRSTRANTIMLSIDLPEEEQEVLSQLLQKALVNLEIEIRHTDRLEFKEMLKERRALLQRLAAKVPARTPTVA